MSKGTQLNVLLRAVSQDVPALGELAISYRKWLIEQIVSRHAQLWLPNWEHLRTPSSSCLVQPLRDLVK